MGYKRGSKQSKQEMEEFKLFMSNFYRTIYKRREECLALCDEYPESIGKYWDELVKTKQLSLENFWQRYFYRCNPQRIKQERERGQVEAGGTIEGGEGEVLTIQKNNKKDNKKKKNNNNKDKNNASSENNKNDNSAENESAE